MAPKSTALVLAALTLSGCVMFDPNDHLIGRQGASNVYEFSVTRFTDSRGAESYRVQRNNFAARICPQGYRIIEERQGVKITQAGDRVLSENVIRIACPT